MSKQITLFHNPRCSKSRAALMLLQAQGVEPSLRLYLDPETPLTRSELQTVLVQSGLRARELLREAEDAWKLSGRDAATLSEAELIAAIVAEPKLLQRPIAVSDGEAVLGRPPERVLELLS